MKRYIFFIAAALLAAVSCGKIYDATPVNTDRAIGFGSWTEQMTKARTQGSSTFVSGDDFAVYGYKEASSTKTTVFDGVAVTYNGTNWDYDNHVYWDASSDSYTFYGVSPASAKTGATITAQTGAISLASITFEGDNGDVLIADKTVVLKDDGDATPETALTYFNSYGAVHIYFNHAASLVDIKVKKSPNLNGIDVKLQSISLDNMKDAGVLSIATGDYTGSATGRPYIPNIAIASWTSPTGTHSYFPADGVTPVKGDVDNTAAISSTNQKTISEDTSFDPANPVTPAASTTLFDNLVVMPQTFGASGDSGSQKISLSYTIGDDPTVYAREAYLADFDSTDDADQEDTKADTGFQPGKHYILYLTIDAHAISFTATIAPWADVTGYHYIIN